MQFGFSAQRALFVKLTRCSSPGRETVPFIGVPAGQIPVSPFSGREIKR
jgi:hypothetical protein